MTEEHSDDWLQSFRNIILSYTQNRAPDPFMTWFRKKEEEGFFKDDYKRVLSILIDARFDQQTNAKNALINTQTVIEHGVLSKELIDFDELPLLIPRQYKSAEEWTKLFCSALPKLHELSKRITEKQIWDVENLFVLILNECRVPYLGDKTSRLAVRWIHELISGLNIDMRAYEIPIDSLVYRVASRLGIIDPYQDKYYGNGSPADQRIQIFVQKLFPQQPWIMDEPLWSTGRKLSDGGCCFPKDPYCINCMFDSICPKKFLVIMPDKIGITSKPARSAPVCRGGKKSESPTEKQRKFSEFISELKRKGIGGTEFREKRAQWYREHKDE